jgi:hypothetical protein
MALTYFGDYFTTKEQILANYRPGVYIPGHLDLVSPAGVMLLLEITDGTYGGNVELRLLTDQGKIRVLTLWYGNVPGYLIHMAIQRQ